MSDTDKTLLEQLNEQRDKALADLDALIESRKGPRDEFEARSEPTDEERSVFDTDETAYQGEFSKLEADVKRVDQRIAEQEIKERRREAAADAARGRIDVTSEPMTYRADNERHVSYFADLAAATVPSVAARMSDPAGAIERLQRHAQELNVELPKRQAARERRAQEQVDGAERAFRGSVVGATNRGLLDTPFERRTNPNRTDGTGGYFVPPLWLIDDYIPALRAGRVAAGRCRQMDLPEGTDSINIPKLSTATATAMQTADGQSVNSQDWTDTSVSAGVQTAAGQSDVSLQLLEQSPGQIVDRVIIEDLMADYNRLVDRQVVLGTNANGQVNGILPSSNWSGANTVTYTSSAIGGPGFNMVLGALASKLSYNRYDLSDVAFLMHPRRWFWFATALDGASQTAGRPVVSADGFGPFNASATNAAGGIPEQGLAGQTSFGLPVYIDGNVPIVATAGGAVTTGSSDLVAAAKWDDLWLFEGSLRTRVLSEVLSGTLQVRFQAYNYIAFLARYGQSISVAAGTGLAAPASAIDSSVTF